MLLSLSNVTGCQEFSYSQFTHKTSARYDITTGEYESCWNRIHLNAEKMMNKETVFDEQSQDYAVLTSNSNSSVLRSLILFDGDTKDLSALTYMTRFAREKGRLLST